MGQWRRNVGYGQGGDGVEDTSSIISPTKSLTKLHKPTAQNWDFTFAAE